jgi:hypothetical protein
MIGRKLMAVCGLCAMAAGCDGGWEDTPPGFMVSDSSGVAVAENRWDETAVTTWELSESPLLRLGSEVAGAPDLFGRIVQASLDPRGALWVVDASSLEIRVFNVPSGEHRFTVGGHGQGPGEFESVHLLGLDDNHAWIWDQSLRRLTTFTLSGSLSDVRPVGQDLELAPRLHSRTASGTFVAQFPQHLGRPVTEGMIVQDTIRIWEFAAEAGESELLAQRAGPIFHFAGGAQHSVPFADGARFAARDRWVVLTHPEGLPTLEVLEEGRLARRIHLARERSPVTTEALDSLRAITGSGGATGAGERLPVPRLAPAWQEVRIGPDGSILALHNYWLNFWMPDARQSWDVFDHAGRFRGLLNLPLGSSLLDVGGEYLVLSESQEGAGPGIAVHAVPPWR